MSKRETCACRTYERWNNCEHVAEEVNRRVGFYGKENVPVGVAFAGILHLEGTPLSFMSLCNRRLAMMADPDELLNDRGYVIKELNICKRCSTKANK